MPYGSMVAADCVCLCHMVVWLASFPVLRQAFRHLHRTASDEKLGVGLGTRLSMVAADCVRLVAADCGAHNYVILKQWYI